MSKVLVKFCAEYAGEYDVMGFRVLDKDVWDKEVEEFRNAQWYADFYFGGNREFLGGDDIDDGWVENNYTATDIYNEEAHVLTKLFGSIYGVFPMPTALISEDDPNG